MGGGGGEKAYTGQHRLALQTCTLQALRRCKRYEGVGVSNFHKKALRNTWMASYTNIYYTAGCIWKQ